MVNDVEILLLFLHMSMEILQRWQRGERLTVGEKEVCLNFTGKAAESLCRLGADRMIT